MFNGGEVLCNAQELATDEKTTPLINEEAMQMGSETYHHLKDIISGKYGADSCKIGDDGGFAPNISRPMISMSEGLDFVIAAIDNAGYKGRIKLAN